MPDIQFLPKLPLHVDVVFRRLFDQPHLLASLLNALLGLQGGERIAVLNILPTQMHGPLADDKEVVLDLRATCQNGRQFHIELQVRPYPFYVARSLFYWAGMYHGQLGSGQSYADLRPVLSIHILYFALLPDEDDMEHPHNLFLVCNRRGGKPLSDHLQLHTIEMGKFLKDLSGLSTEEDFWVYFLKHGHKMAPDEVGQLRLPEIREAEEKLRVISQERELRVLYEQREKAARDKAAYEKDWQHYWLDEGKRLGIDEGKRLGIDEGKRLGIDEGKRLGLKEGLDEGKRQELQGSILDICELLGVGLPPGAQEALAHMDLAELRALRDTLKTTRSWPASIP